MKLKKIILTFLLFFSGILTTHALTADSYEEIYLNYEKVYRIVAATNYYYNNSVQFGGQYSEQDLLAVWQEAYNKFIDKKVANVTRDSLVRLFNNSKSDGGLLSDKYSRNVMEILGINTVKYDSDTDEDKAKKDEYNRFFVELSTFDNFPSMLKCARNNLKNAAKNYENAGGNNKYTRQFEQIEYETKTAYASFCDYLKSHTGISYYVNMILSLVKYVALALVVILGALDFITAIGSDDDAALKKAFKSFTRRLVAVTLIFVTHIIVQLFIGLVTSIPNYDASIALCEVFEK